MPPADFPSGKWALINKFSWSNTKIPQELLTATVPYIFKPPLLGFEYYYNNNILSC